MVNLLYFCLIKLANQKNIQVLMFLLKISLFIPVTKMYLTSILHYIENSFVVIKPWGFIFFNKYFKLKKCSNEERYRESTYKLIGGVKRVQKKIEKRAIRLKTS